MLLSHAIKLVECTNIVLKHSMYLRYATKRSYKCRFLTIHNYLCQKEYVKKLTTYSKTLDLTDFMLLELIYLDFGCWIDWI